MALSCCHAFLCHPYRSSALPISRKWPCAGEHLAVATGPAAIKGRVNKRWDFRGRGLHPLLWSARTPRPAGRDAHGFKSAMSACLPALNFLQGFQAAQLFCCFVCEQGVLLVSFEGAPEYPVCSSVAGRAGSSVPCCCLSEGSSAVGFLMHVWFGIVGCLLAILVEGKWGAPAHTWQRTLSFVEGEKILSCVLHS